MRWTGSLHSPCRSRPSYGKVYYTRSLVWACWRQWQQLCGDFDTFMTDRHLSILWWTRLCLQYEQSEIINPNLETSFTVFCWCCPIVSRSVCPYYMCIIHIVHSHCFIFCALYMQHSSAVYRTLRNIAEGNFFKRWQSDKYQSGCCQVTWLSCIFNHGNSIYECLCITKVNFSKVPRMLLLGFT